MKSQNLNQWVEHTADELKMAKRTKAQENKILEQQVAQHQKDAAQWNGKEKELQSSIQGKDGELQVHAGIEDKLRLQAKRHRALMLVQIPDTVSLPGARLHSSKQLLPCIIHVPQIVNEGTLAIAISELKGMEIAKKLNYEEMVACNIPIDGHSDSGHWKAIIGCLQLKSHAITIASMLELILPFEIRNTFKVQRRGDLCYIMKNDKHSQPQVHLIPLTCT